MSYDEDNNPFSEGISTLNINSIQNYNQTITSDDEGMESDQFVDLPITSGPSSPKRGLTIIDKINNKYNDYNDNNDNEVDGGDSNKGKINAPMGYNSRVENVLKNSKSLCIQILDAHKSNEDHSRGYIVYTIQCNELIVKRRYSEFESLRVTLVRLFPYLIIPPIPEKETVTDYVSASSITSTIRSTAKSNLNSSGFNNNGGNLNGNSVTSIHHSDKDDSNDINGNSNSENGDTNNSTNANNSGNGNGSNFEMNQNELIEHRKRMLNVFLNRCIKIKKILNCIIFQRFLDSNSNWNEVLLMDIVINIPKNRLKSNPINPELSTNLHSYLPIPSTLNKINPVTSNISTANSNVVKGKSKDENEDEEDQYENGNGNGNENENESVTVNFSNNNNNNNNNDNDDDDDNEKDNDDSDKLLKYLNFDKIENNSREYESLICNGIEKSNKKILKIFEDITVLLNELSTLYNSFSLILLEDNIGVDSIEGKSEQKNKNQDNDKLVERISSIYELKYLNFKNNLIIKFYLNFQEPLQELLQFSTIVKELIKFRYKKFLQIGIIKQNLNSKKELLSNLNNLEKESKRINEFISREDRKIEGSRMSFDRSRNTTKRNSQDLSRSISTRNSASKDSDGDKKLAKSTPNLWKGFRYKSNYDGYNEGDDESLRDYSKSIPPQNHSLTSSKFGLGGALKNLSNVFKEKVYDANPERTRSKNILRLKFEVENLENLLKLASHEFALLNERIVVELVNYEKNFKKIEFKKILLNYTKLLVEWFKSDLENWEELKSELQE
ncbi:PX-domain-containing protein [Ascoidea rubescens DSM 1968]|uniref:PX-domain-containing protein n=1 Tax=Ascoidea rubescens DSM 1968 TaxID=1344418 RepID=A0A1D2VIW7_9ASCO|nr:PX-domain-containing protein [Ascoidea rubescens DSM 1968]ODV61520.1 PX-domain-containing protein [Ascoidea rubescens DSM 1968]